MNVLDLGVLSEVRSVLEGFAARLAAERSTDTDRAATVQRSRPSRSSPPRPASGLLIDLDQRIHRHVYACAHNPFLAATLDGYYVLTLRIWFLALRPGQPGWRRGRSALLALLVAIRDGDPLRAEDAMRRHVAGFEQAIRRVL